MIGFDVTPLSNSVEVNWRVVNNHNTDYFEIEKSTDGSNFEKIGRVNSVNSDNIVDYIYSDQNPIEGVSYYRILRVGLNGDQQRTDSKKVIFKKNVPKIEIFPNPTNNEISVLFEIIDDKNIQWKISDMNGRSIISNTVSGSKGVNRTVIDISMLSQGSYIIEMRGESGTPIGFGRIVKN